MGRGRLGSLGRGGWRRAIRCIGRVMGYSCTTPQSEGLADEVPQDIVGAE